MLLAEKMQYIAGFKIEETNMVVPPLIGPSVGERKDTVFALRMNTVRLDLCDLIPSKLTWTSMLPVFVNKAKQRNIPDTESLLTGINSWPKVRNCGADATSKPKSSVNSVRSKATNTLGEVFKDPRCRGNPTVAFQKETSS